MSNQHRPHTLLTVLGKEPRPATYVLGERRMEARVATAALYDLLPESERPDRVLALCTAEAEEDSLPLLRDGLRSRPCEIEVVRVRSDASEQAVHDFLAQMTKHIKDTDLTIDVTHGFRHYSFLTYVGALYLTSLRNVTLRGAYYGLFDEGEGTFLDVRPLIELPLWFYALRVMKKTGGAHAMADLVASSRWEGAPAVADALRVLSEANASALPLELGHLARQFLGTHIDNLEKTLHLQHLPLTGDLVDDFSSVLLAQQVAQALPHDRWKTRVRLDRPELERWTRIIDTLLDRRDYPAAIGLMREWLVLWVMWRQGATGVWLEYGERRRFESILHRLARHLTAGSPMTDGQASIALAWKHVRELRNRHAHHGLDENAVLSTEAEFADRVDVIRKVWRDTLRHVPEIDLPLPPAERALVSPIGTHPGVLFSAISEAQSYGDLARCLVICTDQTQGAIDEAYRRAGYRGEVVRIHLDDPNPDGETMRRLAREQGRQAMDMGELLVNVTGGTTLMGILADRIAGEARKQGLSVSRFALVDRRSPIEQEADPWRRGEVRWLDRSPTEAS